jgi:hypothetical protein
VRIINHLFKNNPNDKLIAFYVGRLRAGETGTTIEVERG